MAFYYQGMILHIIESREREGRIAPNALLDIPYDSSISWFYTRTFQSLMIQQVPCAWLVILGRYVVKKIREVGFLERDVAESIDWFPDRPVLVAALCRPLHGLAPCLSWRSSIVWALENRTSDLESINESDQITRNTVGFLPI
jgi:hypothetical protein